MGVIGLTIVRGVGFCARSQAREVMKAYHPHQTATPAPRQLGSSLDRATSVWDASGPLKSTRDFWTEVAFADRQKLSVGRWRPISDEGSS